MDFGYTNVGAAGVFSLAGRLIVGAKLDDLRRVIGVVLDGRIRGILLDFGRIVQLDCAGIGELLRLRSFVLAAGCTFGLVNVGPRERRLLELARLDTVLGLHDDATGALAGLAAAPAGRRTSGTSGGLFRLRTKEARLAATCESILVGS
jgi:anti-anti-sigma regulatory factor